MLSAPFDILMNTWLLRMTGNVSGPRVELEKRKSARYRILGSTKVGDRTDQRGDSEN